MQIYGKPDHIASQALDVQEILFGKLSELDLSGIRSLEPIRKIYTTAKGRCLST
jgi:hypothetical protein